MQKTLFSGSQWQNVCKNQWHDPFNVSFPWLKIPFKKHIVYSQEEKHHTTLIKSYIKWILQSIDGDYSNETSREEMRHKLQKLLWQSSFYNADTIYGEHSMRIKTFDTLSEKRYKSRPWSGTHLKANDMYPLGVNKLQRWQWQLLYLFSESVD